MKRFVTIQAHEGQHVVVEQLVHEAVNAPEDWAWEVLDRALLKETGHVDIARLRLTYDRITYSPEIGWPTHGIASNEIYLLDGPKAGERLIGVPRFADDVRTLNANNIERYAIEKYREVRFGLHRATERGFGGPGWEPNAN